MSQPVYLVRHGQSEWNVLRRTQGKIAHPRLTPLGRDQAAGAAAVIAADLLPESGSVARIISSDLVRAVETAAILAERLGCEVTLDRRLREQDLGALEGRSYDEMSAAAAAADRNDSTSSAGGGESLMDVYERMSAVLKEIRPGEVTVIVSHGDAISAALAHVRGVLPHVADRVVVSNGAVARIDAGLAWLAE